MKRKAEKIKRESKGKRKKKKRKEETLMTWVSVWVPGFLDFLVEIIIK